MTDQASSAATDYGLTDLDNHSPPRSKLRLRFSLLALFAFVTLACVALAWLVQPKRVVATALFKVNSMEPTLLGEAKPLDEREFELFKNTQLASLKSYYVLESVLRNPGIASLSVFFGVNDPEAWLQEHIEAEFPQNAEILAIRLRGIHSQTNDLVQIVNAVAKAYEDEVIYKMTQRRLGERDLIATSAKKLRVEIERKMQELPAINADSGGKAADDADFILQQLQVEILTDQLRELSRSVERRDIEATLPPRIEPLQRAVVGPE